MKESLLHIQVYYELAMEIGESLHLKKMLKRSLSAYLKKLNCSAGMVLMEKACAFSPIHTIPLRIGRNSACQAALSRIPEDMDEAGLCLFAESLPISGEDPDGKFYHLMELPGFGLLVLVKGGVDFDFIVIQSLKPLNEKLARACITCLQNEKIERMNRQLASEVKERMRAEAAQELLLEELEIRVTERSADLVKVNSRLEREIEEHRQTEASLRRKNAYLEAFRDTSMDLIGHLDLPLLLDAIVNRAILLADASDGFVFQYDPENQALVLKASTGRFADHPHLTLSSDEGLCGKVWLTGNPMVVDDYCNWPEKSRNPAFDSITSIAAFPLKSAGKIEGIIGLSNHKQGEKIGEEAIAVLEQFAELASIALANAQLHTQLLEELCERKRLEMEREKIESRLRHSQKMESIGTLAGGIAHDFNNILSAILGYTELCRFQLDKDRDIRPKLDQIYNAAGRASDLVKQILTFSRQSEEAFAPIELAPVVKEALKLLRSSLPSTIEIRQEIEKAGSISGDPTQIHQVVMNLCTNAFHAMGEDGGTLTVTLTKTAVDAELSSRYLHLPPGPYALLTASDTGHGINADILNRIFDPYFTTKEVGKGTGLGLAVVHGIVKSHGGGIHVYSEKAEGSSFRVYLPLITRQAQQVPVPARAPAPGSERILFVDDEQMLVELGTDILGKLGYQVTGRADAREALALFRSAPDSFDLLITDLTMPHLKGDQLVTRIRAIRPGLPVILCTGFNEPKTQERASQVGVQALLEKPLSINTLAGTIRKVLGAPRRPVPPARPG